MSHALRGTDFPCPLRTDLDWANFHAVAFDMDHTIIRYNVPNLIRLCQEVTVRYLTEIAQIERPAISTAILESPRYSKFASRGLLIDRKRGNFYEVDSDLVICRAWHGSQQIFPSDAAVDAPDAPTLDTCAQADLHDADGYFCGSDPFYGLTTFFDVALGPVYALLVDAFDRNELCSGPSATEGVGSPSNYDQLLSLVQNSFKHNFSDYSRPDAWYFREIERNVAKYVIRQPRVILDFCAALRSRGVCTVLKTNSLPEYTLFLMDYAFGPAADDASDAGAEDIDWRSAFSAVVTHARKPWCFMNREHSYIELTEWKTPSPALAAGARVARIDLSGIMQTKKLYFGGNAGDFIASVRQFANKKDNEEIRICYVGDHLAYDVQIPRAHLNWATVAIVEELQNEDELQRLCRATNIDRSHLPESLGAHHPHPKVGDLMFLTTSSPNGYGNRYFDETANHVSGQHSVQENVAQSSLPLLLSSQQQQKQQQKQQSISLSYWISGIYHGELAADRIVPSIEFLARRWMQQTARVPVNGDVPSAACPPVCP